jgi:hypothetical protein
MSRFPFDIFPFNDQYPPPVSARDGAVAGARANAEGQVQGQAGPEVIDLTRTSPEEDDSIMTDLHHPGVFPGSYFQNQPVLRRRDGDAVTTRRPNTSGRPATTSRRPPTTSGQSATTSRRPPASRQPAAAEITTLPPVLESPRLPPPRAGTITTHAQPSQPPTTAPLPRQYHSRPIITPSRLPTGDELEVVDGYGHARVRGAPRSEVSDVLQHSAKSTMQNNQPARYDARAEPSTDIDHAAVVEDQIFTAEEAAVAKAAAAIPVDLSDAQMFAMPGTTVIADARQHNPAPFSTVDPNWLNEPWLPLMYGQGALQGALRSPVDENISKTSNSEFVRPNLNTDDHSNTPPSPVLSQRAIGMLSTNEQIQRGINRLGDLINLEYQDHFRILRAIVAAHPDWQNSSPEENFNQVNVLRDRQVETFEREFMLRHNVNLVALAATAERFLQRPIPMWRMRQLLEVHMRGLNGLPLQELPPGRELRLRKAVLEAQLLTLQAWTKAWEARLPPGYSKETDQFGYAAFVGHENNAVSGGISDRETEEIKAFSEFLESV